MNGVVRNVDAWHEVFDVTPGGARSRTPEERVHIGNGGYVDSLEVLMRGTVVSVVVLAVLALACPAVVGAQGTVAVYVASAEEGSGFTDRGTDDSVLDLTKALSKKRRLSIIRSQSEADIIVRVESRDSHREMGGVYSYKDSKGKTQVYSTTKTERVVYATLEVDEYRHQFHGEGSTWTAASEGVARQIDKWVDKNLVQLIERRKSGR